MNLFDYFGNMNVFGAGPNAQVQSLLDNKLISQNALDKANKQSIGTGLVTGLASYLAQPQNQNYGDVSPYIAKAFLNANKAAQAPFENLPQQYEMDTKIADRKRELAEIDYTNKTFDKIINSKPELAKYKNAPLSFKKKLIDQEYTKSTTSPELKAFDREDDLYEVDAYGNRTLVRQGVAKPSTKALYTSKPVELANGDFAFLPTPNGLQQGAKPISIDGSPYTGDVTPRGKGMTDPQSKAFKFGNRMEASNANFERLFDEDGNPTYSPVFLASKRNFEKAWLVGDAIGGGMNFFASDEDQLASQSMRDFINSALRDESGAAIAEHEFTNAQAQYFPEVGDSIKVMRQKAENRRIAIQVMKTAAGQDPQAKALAEEYVRQVKAGEDITKTFGGTHFQKTNTKEKETTAKPKPRRAKINGQIIVEDLENGQWIVESTGKPFVQ
jgi:hypothetical protein